MIKKYYILMATKNHGELVTFYLFCCSFGKNDNEIQSEMFSGNYVNTIYKEAEENIQKCFYYNTCDNCQVFVKIKDEFD